MCDAVRNYGDEREAKGEAKGEALKVIQLIKTIMKNTNCSLEEALSMTGCTMEEYNNSLKIANETKD